MDHESRLDSSLKLKPGCTGCRKAQSSNGCSAIWISGWNKMNILLAGGIYYQQVKLGPPSVMGENQLLSSPLFKSSRRFPNEPGEETRTCFSRQKNAPVQKAQSHKMLYIELEMYSALIINM